MAEFLDFDPITGITHYFEHDAMTDETRISYVQDVEPILDYTKRLANDRVTDVGIKRGFWQYAVIPAIVQVHMKQKGINLNDPSDDRALVLPDVQRLNMQLRFDLKQLTGLNLETYVDFLNVLSLRTPTGVVTQDGPTFGTTTGLMEPFRTRIGARFRY